jgi:hypothetical protein
MKTLNTCGFRISNGSGVCTILFCSDNLNLEEHLLGEFLHGNG